MLVGHLERRAERLDQFLVIDQVEGYLTRDDDRWPAREQQGWTVERRERLLAACRAIQARPLWRDLATRGEVVGGLLGDMTRLAPASFRWAS